MQRSISTQTIVFLRSAPRGSSRPTRRQPSSAIRAPSNCPAHMCPCNCSHSFRSSSSDCMSGAFLNQRPNPLDQRREIIMVFVRHVDRVRFVKHLPGRLLNTRIVGTPHHHEKIHVYKLRKTVAFDKHSFGLNSRQRLANTTLNLIVCRNQPVNVGGAYVPISTRVF